MNFVKRLFLIAFCFILLFFVSTDSFAQSNRDLKTLIDQYNESVNTDSVQEFVRTLTLDERDTLADDPLYSGVTSIPVLTDEQIADIERLDKKFEDGIVGSINSDTSCFDYYTFGSVDANIFSKTDNIVSGSETNFGIEITNNNPYAITEGSLYIRVFRKQDDVTKIAQNADNVVDQFVAIENISLKQDERKLYEMKWQVPTYLKSGDYYMASYFYTSDRYNLLGLTFTDDIKGNVEYFSVDGSDSGVYFDKNNVTLNGQAHNFVGAIPTFSKDEVINIEATIVNEKDEDAFVNVNWDLYWWDSVNQTNLIESKKEPTLVKANSEQKISFKVNDNNKSVYLIVPRLEFQDSQSILNIRLARKGISIPRVNYPAVTSYPLVSGQETTFFSCLHNTDESIIDDVKFIAEITDSNGKKFFDYKYEGKVSGAMLGLAETFKPKKDYTDFTIKTTLYSGDKKIDEDVIHYSCQEFGTECPEGDSKNTTTVVIFVIVVLVLILLVGRFLMKRRENNNEIIQ